MPNIYNYLQTANCLREAGADLVTNHALRSVALRSSPGHCGLFAYSIVLDI